ncbi:hypothetical protein S1OALGB6SA_1375 [Olavius algarvensis spirochete endosymbiont]|nr:MAG: hypothetical protein [Olavius algarvensis spirochete endosymbiont]VDB00297.1 hypothetical protein S1OALGB6SA_1375 [Olavius algarvensis spirochete endosymbiont]
MGLFLLLSVPIWLLLVASFYNSRDWIEVFKPFLGGLCIGMLALLITLSLLTRTPFRMNFSGLFWWIWVRGIGLPMLLAIPIIFIACVRNPSPYSRILEIAAYLSGVAVLYNAWYGITQTPRILVYRIFISPIIWIGTIGLIAWLLDRGLDWGGASRYLVLAISILLPFGISLLALVYINNGHYLTWIVSAALAITTSFLVFLDSRG